MKDRIIQLCEHGIIVFANENINTYKPLVILIELKSKRKERRLKSPAKWYYLVFDVADPERPPPYLQSSDGMGCTACARLIVSRLASDGPMYFTFPSSTNFFSSPILHATETRSRSRFNIPETYRNESILCRGLFLRCPQCGQSNPLGVDSRDLCTPRPGDRGSLRSTHFPLVLRTPPSSFTMPNLLAPWTSSLGNCFNASKKTRLSTSETQVPHQRENQRERSNLSDQDLIFVLPEAVGGVEEGDTAIEGLLDEGDAFFVAQRSVDESSELEAPETQSRHLEASETWSTRPENSIKVTAFSSNSTPKQHKNKINKSVELKWDRPLIPGIPASPWAPLELVFLLPCLSITSDPRIAATVS